MSQSAFLVHHPQKRVVIATMFQYYAISLAKAAAFNTLAMRTAD